MEYINGGFFEEDQSQRAIFIKGVSKVDKGQFMGDKDLEEVFILDGVKVIDNNAFSCCKNLKTVAFPQTLQEIGIGAFHGCEKLRSITLPDSLEQIGWGAFENCVNLKFISLPLKTKMEYNAFNNLHDDAVIKFRLSPGKVDSIPLSDSSFFDNIYLSKDGKELTFSRKRIKMLEDSAFKVDSLMLDMMLDDKMRKIYITTKGCQKPQIKSREVDGLEKN